MTRRLSTIDLPKRLSALAPAWLVAVGVGLVGAGVAVLVRWLVQLVTPGPVPFLILFPVMLLATVAAGWRAGVVTLVMGNLAIRMLLHPPTLADTMDSRTSLVTAILFMVASTLIITITAVYRGVALAKEEEGERAATERDRLLAEQRLQDSQTRLRMALTAGRMAVWQVDTVRRVVIGSPELSLILGRPDDLPFTQDSGVQGYLPGERERIRDVAQAAMAQGERFFEVEFQYRRMNDGEERWMWIRAEMTLDDAGRMVGALGIIMDVTDRKADEERLRLLAREVDHRANNLLAVVQGTVQLSKADSAPALKAVIVGRVAALARAHQLLSDARWQGADLRRLVEEELLAFTLGDAARACVTGPAVALGPAAAQAIAMALHELATNAAKYGALSQAGGRVDVAWRTGEAGDLRIGWHESGGPPVKTPTRKGLGTTLLSRALAGQLGGAARLDWRPEGLVCELELPAAMLKPAGAADRRG